MKKSLFLLLVLPLLVLAQPQSGYYSSAVDKYDAALKTALFQKVGPHTERTYSQLWTDFESTDKRADGKVWDMYSTCSFTFGDDQDKGSGGSSECDYYNREHSFPNSWFAKAYPMYSDLFHLYPTDKYVNNKRGNYPYGETSSPSQTFSNGSRLGSCTFPGYSGTVFEPTDEYKGDFARTYFYMVTAYEDKISTWSSEHLDGNSYPGLNSWSVNLLLKWHRQDPVSTKETKRNDAVEDIQHNRNPYIDFPSLAEHIWGTEKGIPWTLSSGLETLKVEFSIYPNPVKNTINIKTNQANFQYSVLTLDGVELLHEQINTQKTISIDQFPNGMYLLQLSYDKGKSIHKFVVNK